MPQCRSYGTRDTRKACQWIDEVRNDIAAVLAKFSFGKTFEEAMDKAAELDIRLQSPALVQRHLLRCHAHGVFRNFIDNYQVVC